MESARPPDGANPGPGPAPLEIRLLGSLAVLHRGVAVPLPASRKVRGLLAYLALAGRPVLRSQLCDLLWDDPGDPRGELRWCLSKLRRVLDSPPLKRVKASGDTVELDLTDAEVDAVEIARAADSRDVVDPGRLARLHARFGGDLLAGLEFERCPEFAAWLGAERRRLRGREVALVEHLATTADGEAALPWLERWLELAPFDPQAHERLLQTLAALGRHAEGEAHVDAAVRRFVAEGLEVTPLRAAWRRVRGADPGRGADTDPGAVPRAAAGAGEDAHEAPVRRASVAVMPFADASGERGGHADGLAHDVIMRLAKLRSLFVIAPGTMFTLRERGVGAEDAARTLGVDYVVTGTVRRRGSRLAVAVELAEARTSRVAWADTFEQPVDTALEILDEIGDRIVAAVASEIETAERNRALLKSPNSLDAWEALHRGLWHAYRFNREDNERARRLFATAARLDPTFARAHAALSFTHWQNAFQGWGSIEAEIDLAYESAGRSLLADDRDPAAHFAMGRALWLRGAQEPSLLELGHAVDLSPNFALGHYALAFVHSQAGDPQAAIASADRSHRLSPFDPLLFAMYGARAMALVRLERFDEAREWAVKAAARPNAHVHIHVIAALTLALAGDIERAQAVLAEVRRVAPDYSLADYLRTFRFDDSGRSLYSAAARRLGLPH